MTSFDEWKQRRSESRATRKQRWYMTPGARRAILIRDIWNILITGIAVWAVVVSVQVSKDTNNLIRELANTRAQAVLDGCLNDQAQDNVLRAMLNVSLKQTKELEERGVNRDGPTTSDDREKLVERLMRPLGGLHPTKKQLRQQCKRRLFRGTPKDAADQLLEER